MIFQSYEKMFENPFSPHIEVLHITWDWKPYIRPEFVDKLQKSNEFKEDIPESDNTTLPAESKVINYEIRTITPKKHFWRK